MKGAPSISSTGAGTHAIAVTGFITVTSRRSFIATAPCASLPPLAGSGLRLRAWRRAFAWNGVNIATKLRLSVATKLRLSAATKRLRWSGIREPDITKAVRGDREYGAQRER